jgi:hypothetical protein
MTYSVPVATAGKVFLRVVGVSGSSATPATPTPSSPKIDTTTSDLTAAGFTLRWSAAPGQKFTVQYSTDLNTWTAFSGTVTAPASGNCEFIDTQSQPPATTVKTRYYRLLVAP